jgi:perosamine synthetase
MTHPSPETQIAYSPTLSQSVEVPLKIRMFAPYISEQAIARVIQTLRSNYIGEGPVVKEFEKTLQQLFGIQYPVAVNSGTASLELALDLLEIGPGDEVITTALTFMATSHVILARGAKPIFADVDYLTGNLSVADIEHRITAATKAILPVHWGGYPCDMAEILDISERHAIPVIEDAAQALGAQYRGQWIGTLPTLSCFSFQGIKQVTCGDGGLLSVPDRVQYDSARQRRWFGIDREQRQPTLLGEAHWLVTEVGYKMHMNDIAASLGVEHLREWSQIADRRQAIVNQYRQQLEGVAGITLFENSADRQSANWLFSIHVHERRENFVHKLRQLGIEVSVVHLRIDTQPIFGGTRDDLPNLAQYCETVMALPLHNLLSDEDIATITTAIRSGW